MKKFFAPAATEAVAAAPAPELTSEKLTALKAEYAKAWQEMVTQTDPFAESTKNAKMKVWTIEGQMKSELAELQKAANEAKIAEMRNERLKLNENQLAAYAVLLGIRADKKADPAKVTEAEQAFITARELVDNELLAKYAASKPAKAVTSSDHEGSDTDKAAILELARTGMSKKDIEAKGYARSTVWHAIDKAKKAGEVFPNH